MTIRCENAEPGIVHLVIDNPARRNALDLAMFQALAELWPRLAGQPAVRAVVISGAGDAAFCSGADLSAGLADVAGIDDLIERALLKTMLFPKPLIAAITGHCMAGGLELALAADIRLAREDALLGLPEVRWGIVPSGGAAMKLGDQIGHARAMDLLLSGAPIDGCHAERIGLVNAALPAGEVLPAAMARARLIAANSPTAVSATKWAALQRRYGDYRAEEPRERALVAQVRAAGDQKIGMKAFLERCKPVYGDAGPIDPGDSANSEHARSATYAAASRRGGAPFLSASDL